jgi:Type IX secretion system membrane protein PorP/SprF
MKRISFFILLCFNYSILFAQDAVITQFFNAPLANNPALAAHGSNSLNLYANYRQQWIGASSSYNTMRWELEECSCQIFHLMGRSGLLTRL